MENKLYPYSVARRIAPRINQRLQLYCSSLGTIELIIDNFFEAVQELHKICVADIIEYRNLFNKLEEELKEFLKSQKKYGGCKEIIEDKKTSIKKTKKQLSKLFWKVELVEDFEYASYKNTSEEESIYTCLYKFNYSDFIKFEKLNLVSTFSNLT